VGIDAATGREIPRSYVDWLEKRVKHLELELNLQQPKAESDEATIDPTLQSGWGDDAKRQKWGSFSGSTSGAIGDVESVRDHQTPRDDQNDGSNGEGKALHLRPDIENLVNQVGLVGVQGTSAPGFMGGSSGISYALFPAFLSACWDVQADMSAIQICQAHVRGSEASHEGRGQDWP
jgi:hypothetical protein